MRSIADGRDLGPFRLRPLELPSAVGIGIRRTKIEARIIDAQIRRPLIRGESAVHGARQILPDAALALVDHVITISLDIQRAVQCSTGLWSASVGTILNQAILK